MIITTPSPMMGCKKCGELFPEKEIQLSHDVPKYIGGTDKDGRHYLCKKCHDVYERIVFSIMVKDLTEETKENMRKKAIGFSKRYFNGGEDDTTKITG